MYFVMLHGARPASPDPPSPTSDPASADDAVMLTCFQAAAGELRSSARIVSS